MPSLLDLDRESSPAVSAPASRVCYVTCWLRTIGCTSLLRCGPDGAGCLGLCPCQMWSPPDRKCPAVFVLPGPSPTSRLSVWYWTHLAAAMSEIRDEFMGEDRRIKRRAALRLIGAAGAAGVATVATTTGTAAQASPPKPRTRSDEVEVPPPYAVYGDVASVDVDRLTLRTKDGTADVRPDEQTRMYSGVSGTVQSTQVFEVGDRVIAYGELDGQGRVRVTRIGSVYTPAHIRVLKVSDDGLTAQTSIGRVEIGGSLPDKARRLIGPGTYDGLLWKNPATSKTHLLVLQP